MIKKKKKGTAIHNALCVQVMEDPSSIVPQRSHLEPRDQLHTEVAVYDPSPSHLQRSQLWQESHAAVQLAKMLED